MRKLKFIIAAMLMATGVISSAQDKSKNPFGLVYGDAISENENGKVNIHPVIYKLNGIDIAANVYTPAGYDASKSYPAVVVAHPNGGVKEQTAGLYAQRLAEAGYITIAARSEEHTSELQSRENLVCRLLLDKKKQPVT